MFCRPCEIPDTHGAIVTDKCEVGPQRVIAGAICGLLLLENSRSQQWGTVGGEISLRGIVKIVPQIDSKVMVKKHNIFMGVPEMW